MYNVFFSMGGVGLKGCKFINHQLRSHGVPRDMNVDYGKKSVGGMAKTVILTAKTNSIMLPAMIGSPAQG